MNTLVQITENELQSIDFNTVELYIPFHDYSDKGDEHRLVADDWDFFYDNDVMVRCFKLYATMNENDDRPDVDMETVELWIGDEQQEITPQQAYHIEQKVKQSIEARLY